MIEKDSHSKRFGLGLAVVAILVIIYCMLVDPQGFLFCIAVALLVYILGTISLWILRRLGIDE